RPQPLYFYLPHLLHKFAPWSALMIGVAFFDLASRRWRIGAAFREMSPETFWLLCWSLGGLIAMSLIPSKRVDRIFPIVPPLYLRRTHFIEPDQAIAEWNRGNLDALVAPTEKAPALLGGLRGTPRFSLQSNERKNEQAKDYVLITR